jgi:hypothetical protein
MPLLYGVRSASLDIGLRIDALAADDMLNLQMEWNINNGQNV